MSDQIEFIASLISEDVNASIADYNDSDLDELIELSRQLHEAYNRLKLLHESTGDTNLQLVNEIFGKLGQKLGAYAAKLEAGKAAAEIYKNKEDIIKYMIEDKWDYVGKIIGSALRKSEVTDKKKLAAVINWFYQSSLDLTGSKNLKNVALGKLFAILGTDSIMTIKQQSALLRGRLPDEVQVDRELASVLRGLRDED